MRNTIVVLWILDSSHSVHDHSYESIEVWRALIVVGRIRDEGSCAIRSSKLGPTMNSEIKAINQA